MPEISYLQVFRIDYVSKANTQTSDSFDQQPEPNFAALKLCRLWLRRV
jgi:hypothetical protein